MADESKPYDWFDDPKVWKTIAKLQREIYTPQLVANIHNTWGRKPPDIEDIDYGIIDRDKAFIVKEFGSEWDEEHSAVVREIRAWLIDLFNESKLKAPLRFTGDISMEESNSHCGV